MMTDVIQALAQHWNDIVGLLSDQDRQAVAGPAGELLAAGDAAARREAALDIVEIVAPLLPADHPVRRALAGESTRYAEVAQNWDAPIGLLRDSLARLDLGSGRPIATEQAQADEQAEDWLLAAPAVDAAEVRRRGLDPDSPGLLRIGRAGRDWRWPAFQFDAAGRPFAVVTQINLLLNADGDPWGVADWWLGPNAWLDATPAELIGRIGDELLLDAATALLAGA
jgi:hypothetical protein